MTIVHAIAAVVVLFVGAYTVVVLVSVLFPKTWNRWIDRWGR